MRRGKQHDGDHMGYWQLQACNSSTYWYSSNEAMSSQRSVVVKVECRQQRSSTTTASRRDLFSTAV